MEYISIENVHSSVSRIILGTACMPLLVGGDGSAILDEAMANGINTFDIARNYYRSENSVGDWLRRRNNRKDVVLISKCGHPDTEGNRRVNEKDIRADFEVSSGALGTDYIDIYLLHRDDENIPVGEIVEIMNALHREGKIGAFGGSNWTHSRIEEANRYAKECGLIPFIVSSPNFGLARQAADPWGGGCITISGPENELARQWYKTNQMPVFAYSSLGRGMFSGMIKSSEEARAKEILDAVAIKGYAVPDNFERLRRAEILAQKYGAEVSQIALCWLFKQGLQCCAIASATKPEYIEKNCAALNISMTMEEAAWLNLERGEA